MYNKRMIIDWDEDKRTINKAKRGVDFEVAFQMGFSSAKVLTDDRFDYGETRYNMYAPIVAACM